MLIHPEFLFCFPCTSFETETSRLSRMIMESRVTKWIKTDRAGSTPLVLLFQLQQPLRQLVLHRCVQINELLERELAQLICHGVAIL